MSHWVERTIDELGYVSRGRSRHRPRDAAHLYGGDYPFIQTGDIKHSNLYITQYSQTYSEAGLEQSRLWKAGTLCITIAANIADTAILTFDACFPDSVIGFIPDEEKSDARFVKYLFDAMLQKQFKQFTQGAAQDNLSQEKLLSLKFPVPSDVKIQNRIADILSAYDDLIENNRRRIDLLEQSVRLLYKEWFVSLRFPGHEHVKVKDGVPQGWKEVKFPDVVDFKEGPGLRNYQYREEGIPFLNIRTISDDEIDLTKTQFLDENEVTRQYSHFLLQENDHVVSSSGTLGRVVTVRQVHLPLMLNTSLIRMRPIPPFRKWFLKAYLKYSDFSERMKLMATGAAQLNFGPVHLKPYNLILPEPKFIDLFEEEAEPIYEQIKILLDLNMKLKQARDLLLPRLMNGEIPV